MLLPLILFAGLYPPQTTDVTLPPANAHVRYMALGRGVQIYKCLAASDGFGWVYQAPEADLIDAKTHEPVATHGAGPTWTWKDGSSIIGKVVQKRVSDDPANIPWLLLETHSSGSAVGALSQIRLVRRSETQAGVAPATGCDAQHRDEVLRVPYAATYTFYSVTP
jgi:hypothetical protein